MTFAQWPVPGGGSSGPVPGTFNPSDKSSDIQLVNSNRTARGLTSTAGSVRGLTSRSAGVLYFEINSNASYNNGNATTIAGGVCESTMSLSLDPIFGAAGGKRVGVRANSQYGNDGGYIGAGVSWWTVSGTIYTIGFKVTFATRQVEIFFDGVLKYTTTWSSGGSGVMFPFAWVSDNTGVGDAVLATTAATFIQGIPSGASAWDS